MADDEVKQGTPIPVDQVTEKTASDTDKHLAEGETTDSPPSNPKALSVDEAQETDLSTKDFTIQTDAEELETSDGTSPHDEDADGEPDEDEEGDE